MDAGYSWFLAYLAFRSCDFTVGYRHNNLVSVKRLEIVFVWQILGLVFVAGKIGGNFNLSVSNDGRFLFLFKNPDFCWFKNGSWHRANLAVMFCGFSAIKVKTSKQKPPKCKIKGVHNKSFKPTALRAAA